MPEWTPICELFFGLCVRVKSLVPGIDARISGFRSISKTTANLTFAGGKVYVSSNSYAMLYVDRSSDWLRWNGVPKKKGNTSQ